jgi:membrane protease YdiL (CAAX protease family)
MQISKETAEKLRGFEPIEPFWLYIAVATVFEVIPDIVILWSVTALLQSLGFDVIAWQPGPIVPASIAGMVIWAPLFETLVLAGLIAILSIFIRKPLAIAIVSAVCWGLIHSLRSPIGFLGVTVGFFVLSYSYISWKKKSFFHGYIAALIPHAINNLIAVGLLALPTFE